MAEMHPVQTVDRKGGRLSSDVTLRAYEVYSHVYAPQPAMIDLKGRNCRGGFSTSEIIAFLYARSFPKQEWSDRVDEAMRGAEHV